MKSTYPERGCCWALLSCQLESEKNRGRKKVFGSDIDMVTFRRNRFKDVEGYRKERAARMLMDWALWKSWIRSIRIITTFKLEN